MYLSPASAECPTQNPNVTVIVLDARLSIHVTKAKMPLHPEAIYDALWFMSLFSECHCTRLMDPEEDKGEVLLSLEGFRIAIANANDTAMAVITPFSKVCRTYAIKEGDDVV